MEKIAILVEGKPQIPIQKKTAITIQKITFYKG